MRGITRQNIHICQRGCGTSPEDGEAERPQHQWPAQVQLLALSHEVLPGEHKHSVQATEDERLVAGSKTQKQLLAWVAAR